MKKIIEQLKDLSRNTVVRNIVLVSSITLILKGVAFLKESIVAAHFGLSEMLDTFFIAFLVPGFISNVFLGAFKSVFIPNYVNELSTKNNIGSFQATGFLVTTLVSVFFMFIAILITDTFLEDFFAGHSEHYYQLIKIQFYWILPSILLWGLTSLLSGILNINNEFRYTSFETIFVPVSMIVCLMYFQEELGDAVLAIGTLIGSFAAFLYLLMISYKKGVLHFATPNFRNENALLMFRQVPAKVSSGFLTGMNGVVDQYFAAQLAIGSIAAINYGMKMPAFFRGILVIALTNVLLPHFSKMFLKNKEKSFKDLFKMIKIVFVGCVVIAAIGIITTEFFVELFFERKEFTSEDTALVSVIQQIFLVYIPFTITGMIIVNFLTSINRNAYMAYVSFVALIINIILDYILMQYFGILGIAICTTIVVIIKNLLLFSYTLKLSRSQETI